MSPRAVISRLVVVVVVDGCFNFQLSSGGFLVVFLLLPLHYFTTYLKTHFSPRYRYRSSIVELMTRDDEFAVYFGGREGGLLV